MLSDVNAQRLPKEDKERDEQEYLALLAVFNRYVDAHGDEEARLALAEELMALRADYAVRHACDGFGMTLEEAIELLQATDKLSEHDIDRKKILAAAFDNLVDFSVAEEYQMLTELPEEWDEGNEDDDEEDEENLKIFKTYNHRYARIENSDIEYAMMVAASLVSVRNTAILTYMTQGDERVRPWHRQYEGVTAPKSSFPAWLVPPIEHQCRCYLIEDDVMDQIGVQAALKSPSELKMPDWFNRTFKECVAFGGRIFSDEHPYFQIDVQHFDRLKDISDRIKEKYFNGISN